MQDEPGVEVVDDGRALRLTAETDRRGWSPGRPVLSDLPPPPPLPAQARAHGLFTDRDFSLTYGFVAPNGQTLPSLASRADRHDRTSSEYTLLEPLFEIVTALDALSRLRRQDVRSTRADTRADSARAWATEPANAMADQYLTTSTITSAESFTIRPRVDAAGAIDFDVQPVRESEGQEERFRQSLPDAREAEWNRHFRRLPLRTCYPAGAGHYVVVTPVLREALGVAKRMTTASPEQKREFVRNPRPFLREALPAAAGRGDRERVLGVRRVQRTRARHRAVAAPSPAVPQEIRHRVAS